MRFEWEEVGKSSRNGGFKEVSIGLKCSKISVLVCFGWENGAPSSSNWRHEWQDREKS